MVVVVVVLVVDATKKKSSLILLQLCILIEAVYRTLRATTTPALQLARLQMDWSFGPVLQEIGAEAPLLLPPHSNYLE